MEDSELLADADENSPASLSLPVWLRCCNTLEEMLRDRGWNSLKWSAPESVLFRQFCHAQSLVVQLLQATDYRSPTAETQTCNVCGAGNACSLVVYSCLTKNLTSPAIQNIETLRHAGNFHSLVLFQDKITAIPRYDASGYTLLRRFEAKPFRCLYINVSRHKLVPPHRRLTKAEVCDFLVKFKCTVDKLPVLFVTDPVCRYYDFPVGSIVEICRPDPHYRYVTHAPANTNYEKFFAQSLFIEN